LRAAAPTIGVSLLNPETATMEVVEKKITP
jgi:hypothetical protein